ncbi:MAG: hypothetical protein KAX19_12745, partial [Candidatus Brocadiae bacterium]|nr:hypothetical protein [Candidatus Brocadiia bacterium]
VLARRLSAISPHATCKPCPHRLPLAGKLHEDFLEQIGEADIILDFSTSEQAFGYLDNVCRSYAKLLVSGYVSFGAKSFCMFSNSVEQTAEEAETRLLSLLEGDGSYDALFPAPPAQGRILEGAGCWHPTFPGTEHQIAGWAAFAVAQLEQYVTQQLEQPLGVVATFADGHDAGVIKIVHRL